MRRIGRSVCLCFLAAVLILCGVTRTYKGMVQAHAVSESIESAENTQSGESIESAESAQTMESAESAESAQTIESSESAESAQTMESSESAESTQTMESTESAESAQSEESAESAERTQSVESAESTESEQNSESEESSGGDGRRRILDFVDFEEDGTKPYKTLKIFRSLGQRSYLILPATVKVILADGEAQETHTMEALWVCDQWEDPTCDRYIFTLDLDETVYGLSEEGTMQLPFIEVDVQEAVLSRSYNPDPEQSTVITVNQGLIYIPGTTTSTYDFMVNGKRAFCMQHPIPSAADGMVLTPAIYDNPDIQKTLYYGFDGVKPYPGFTCEAAGIVLTSLALSYFYMGDYVFAPTWIGGAYGAYSHSIGFAQFLDYIKAQPYDPGFVKMAFSKDHVKAYISGEVQRTEEISFSYVDGEYVTLNLPASVTVVNVTQDTKSQGQCRIYSGDRFYFQAPLSLRGSYDSGAVTGSRGRFAPMLCITSSSTQDVGYGEWVEDKEHTISIGVSWVLTAPVEILKVDSLTKKPLAGVHLRVTDGSGTIVDTWTSTESSRKITGLEVGKSYTLEETKTLDGYILAKPVTFTVSATDMIKPIVMENIPTQCVFEKIDIDERQRIFGADLKVMEKGSGKVIASWTSGEKGHLVKYLAPGKTYIYSEARPASGFVTAQDIEFTVEETGEKQIVTMVDDYTKLRIRKVDKTTKKPVIGAKLALLDSKGNTVETWITDDEPKMFYKLTVGEKYVLRELEAPKGYVTAKDVTFVVADTGEIQEIIMEDDSTQVEISKTDSDSGALIAGAHFTLYDSQGKVADQWVSSEEPHKIQKLQVGMTYKLVETQPPDGYLTGDDVSFTVKDTGEIQKIVFKNRKTAVIFEKLDKENGEALLGAQLKLTDEDGNLIDEWISGDEGHCIYGLCVGKTYTLTEVKPPAGYATAKPKVFTVKDRRAIMKVALEDRTIRVAIDKLDSVTGEVVPGAKLRLLNASGEELADWTSQDTSFVAERLTAGEAYTVEETKAPQGYDAAPPQTFMVKDTEEIQKIAILNVPKKPVEDKPESPQTGDPSQLSKAAAAAGAALLCAAAMGLSIYLRKKKTTHS